MLVLLDRGNVPVTTAKNPWFKNNLQKVMGDDGEHYTVPFTGAELITWQPK